MGKEINAKGRIVAFIPAYAAYLYNRLHRVDDGKVAYERIKGERPTVVGVDFGEKESTRAVMSFSYPQQMVLRNQGPSGGWLKERIGVKII
eukprot:53305-Karenia_brevis.AAC.1